MRLKEDYFRNLIFGAEDSLVSTVGVVFGVATATSDINLILTTGLIVITVEALSMGAGAYLSEASTHEFVAEKHDDNPIIGGLIMFFSYFFSGFFPLAPYVFLPLPVAKVTSVIVGILALFILGYLPQRSLKAALRMAIVAGLAVFLGFAVASVFGVR